MITTVLLGLAALFVYLQIGYWLGHLYWWTWRTTERKKRVLTFLLFPLVTLFDMSEDNINREGVPHISNFENSEDGRNKYFTFKTLTWPFTVLWCAIWIPIGGIWFLGVAVVRMIKKIFDAFVSSPLLQVVFFLWFFLTAGPKALVVKTIEWVRARKLAAGMRTRVAEEVVGAVSSPLLTSDERTRAEEYRRVCEECDDLEEKLAPRKARRAEIEAEDAATHDAFRDLPQEMRLPKA